MIPGVARRQHRAARCDRDHVGRNEDSLDIVVVRADQQIWANRWEGNWSGWRAIGGRVARAGAPLALTARTDQWMHLCWAAEGGSVETAWWNRVQANGGWSLDNGVRLRVPTESVRFDADVDTDTDNLSGQVMTRLWRTGAFLVSGHVHGSGFDPYRFSTQSIILTVQGFAVANEHRGRVDGTGSEPFPWDPKPDQDHYWNDCGVNPVVSGAYDELAAGDPVASLMSKNIGLGGGLDRLLKDVMEFVFTPLVISRKITQFVTAIGPGLNELLRIPWVDKLPGPQSAFVYAGGVGWASFLGFAVPMLPYGVELGSGLDPSVAHRPIEADEYAFADQVFLGALPPRGEIYLTDAVGTEGRPYVFPVTTDGPFLMNVGEAYDDPMTYTSDSYPEPGQLFIHELTHVWHLAHTHLDYRTWLLRGINDGDYDPEVAGTPWSDFGIEEKAATVDRWYHDHRQEGLDSRPAFTDPYYRYIHLVRTRVTGD